MSNEMPAIRKMDPEVAAMAALSEALDPLSDEVRVRVLAWARSRYAPAIGPAMSAAEPTPARVSGLAGYTTLAEFVAACGADTDSGRVLATATFVTQRNAADSFTAAEIQSELKHLGYGVGNITRVIDGLSGQRPQLVVQLKKQGNTRQARKVYKVTEAGIQETQRMLAGSSAR